MTFHLVHPSRAKANMHCLRQFCEESGIQENNVRRATEVTLEHHGKINKLIMTYKSTTKEAWYRIEK